MIFDYNVKYKGVIYRKGEDVPMETESPFVDSAVHTEDTTLDLEHLNALKVSELKEVAEKHGINLVSTKKSDIIAEILEKM